MIQVASSALWLCSSSSLHVGYCNKDGGADCMIRAFWNSKQASKLYRMAASCRYWIPRQPALHNYASLSGFVPLRSLWGWDLPVLKYYIVIIVQGLISLIRTRSYRIYVIWCICPVFLSVYVSKWARNRNKLVFYQCIELVSFFSKFQILL